jgi:hypothetical protein
VATLTARDIARRIQRPGEKLQAAVDRVRNWTKEGIIGPIGDAHPGTGRKKKYSEAAARRAGILQALSDATGGAAVFLAHMIDDVERELQKSYGVKDRLFAISRKFGGGGKFEMSTWETKKFGQGILESTADIHIVLNPNRILGRIEQEPDRGERP